MIKLKQILSEGKRTEAVELDPFGWSVWSTISTENYFNNPLATVQLTKFKGQGERGSGMEKSSTKIEKQIEIAFKKSVSTTEHILNDIAKNDNKYGKGGDVVHKDGRFKILTKGSKFNVKWGSIEKAEKNLSDIYTQTGEVAYTNPNKSSFKLHVTIWCNIPEGQEKGENVMLFVTDRKGKVKSRFSSKK